MLCSIIQLNLHRFIEITPKIRHYNSVIGLLITLIIIAHNISGAVLLAHPLADMCEQQPLCDMIMANVIITLTVTILPPLTVFCYEFWRPVPIHTHIDTVLEDFNNIN